MDREGDRGRERELIIGDKSAIYLERVDKMVAWWWETDRRGNTRDEKRASDRDREIDR